MAQNVATMTEAQVERAVEARTNGLDRAYMTTGMTEAEYKASLAAIDAWAKAALGGGTLMAAPTCQCCGRFIKLVRGRIALHGYQRPSHMPGFQTSSCMGANHLPFEQSRDRLGDLLALLAKSITATEEAVVKMQIEPTILTLRPGHYGFNGWVKATTIEPGELLYPRRLQEWVNRQIREIHGLTRELAEQQARYDAWVAPAQAAA